jgi:hypothetical protein
MFLKLNNSYCRYCILMSKTEHVAAVPAKQSIVSGHAYDLVRFQTAESVSRVLHQPFSAQGSNADPLELESGGQ